MNVKEFIGEVIVHAAAGFAETLARKTEPGRASNPTTKAATTIGRQLAEALALELGANAPTQRVIRGTVVRPKKHPTYSDEQILTERMAVWNHPISLPPELQRMLKHPRLTAE